MGAQKRLASLAAIIMTLFSLAGTGAKAGAAQFVLSPEGNNLWAYDAATKGAQLVNLAQNGSSTETPPAGSERKDINGQVCVAPDDQHIITGEDTVTGGSSHNPLIAGWGYWEISGSTLGDIRVKQVGKLAPEAAGGPGYTGDPDNFGCGWLDSDRLVTTAIGNTLPGEPANGQLFVWFGPFTTGFHSETIDGATFVVGDVEHCVIDSTLATAGGISVDGNGDVYVATNRPDDAMNAGSIWRFSGTWPTSKAECSSPGWIAGHITKTQIIPLLPIPLDPFSPTPSSVVISPAGTLYVSSVFTGTVSEYSKAGLWMRDIWPLSPVAPRLGPTGDTPFGLAFTADGTLWIADLGIVGDGPVDGQGSVIRVPWLVPDILPMPLGERVKEGITFPDGLGVYTPA